MEEAYELRCASRMHGLVRKRGRDWVMEVRCHSRFCGKRKGVVVIHYFDIDTGKLIDTKEFQDVELKIGRREDSDSTNVTSVRYAGSEDDPVRRRGGQ
jgi:hypothetical protein